MLTHQVSNSGWLFTVTKCSCMVHEIGPCSFSKFERRIVHSAVKLTAGGSQLARRSADSRHERGLAIHVGFSCECSRPYRTYHAKQRRRPCQAEAEVMLSRDAEGVCGERTMHSASRKSAFATIKICRITCIWRINHQPQCVSTGYRP